MTTVRKPRPQGPTPDRLREQIAPKPAAPHPYISIKLQDGPVGEVGVNGAQIDEVIFWCHERLTEFYQRLPDQHTDNAIEFLELAVIELNERRKDRTARGVEGTSQP